MSSDRPPGDAAPAGLNDDGRVSHPANGRSGEVATEEPLKRDGRQALKSHLLRFGGGTSGGSFAR